MYVHGRDRNFRPLIVIRPRVITELGIVSFLLITDKTEHHDGIMACVFMMEYVRANLFIPGQVENWNLLIDLDNLGLMGIPYKSLKSFLETLQGQYRCTSARVFIMNVSYVFNVVWSTVKGFLEEHTKRKIQISKAGTCDELQALFAPNQLEVKYGGSSPNVEGPQFWPPIMPDKDVGVD